jgi:hypothetical protein
MRPAYVLLPVLLLLAACETNVTCNNVDMQIAVLKDRGAAGAREKNKIYKVDAPASTYRVVVEEEVPPGKMTAKEREAKLAAAVKELQDFEEGCGIIEKRDRARWGKRNVIKTHSDISDW